MEASPRRMLAGAVAALVLAVCSALSFLGAFHAPAPHRLPVAFVSDPASLTRTQAALDAAHPGAIALTGYASADQARAAVRDRTVDAAVAADPGGWEMDVAGAGGSAVVQALTQAFTAAAAAHGQQLRVVDLVPTAAGDRSGLSAFFLCLAVLFASLFAGTVTALVDRVARVPVRVGVLAGFAVVVGLAAAGIADGVYGALPGRYPALVGVLALFSFAVALTAAGLARLFRFGPAVTVLVFLVVGVPVTGGPAGLAGFLPAFYRALNPVLPLSTAITALTNAQYFGGHAIAGRLLVLAAWAAAGLLIVILTAVRGTRTAATSPAP